jgi:hypothetical protein
MEANAKFEALVVARLIVTEQETGWDISLSLSTA